MKKIDRIREKVSILPTSMYLSKMHDAGWSLVALEWEREVEVEGEPPEPTVEAGSEEIPFGLPPSGRRPSGNADSEVPDRIDRSRRFLQEHGRRSECPRVSHPGRPPMERGERVQTDSPADRGSPAHYLRYGMGIAEEAALASGLELVIP
jgi:hypothetical protein